MIAFRKSQSAHEKGKFFTFFFFLIKDVFWQTEDSIQWAEGEKVILFLVNWGWVMVDSG